MNIRPHHTLAAMLLFLCCSCTASAADTVSTNSSTTIVSLETDPSTFVLKGYAVHLRVKPESSNHWMLGAGTYALDLPDFVVDMNSKNDNLGWDVRISSAYSLFGEYYFKEANEGWFSGLQAGIQNIRIRNSSSEGEEARFRNLLLMPSIGYTWHPFDNALYLKTWLGVGYATKISGQNTINSLTYDVANIVPFTALHIGYSF